jgi:hypothetical protein
MYIELLIGIVGFVQGMYVGNFFLSPSGKDPVGTTPPGEGTKLYILCPRCEYKINSNGGQHPEQ